eukprot:6492645-Prymnesium_polylepis.2
MMRGMQHVLRPTDHALHDKPDTTAQLTLSATGLNRRTTALKADCVPVSAANGSQGLLLF